MQKHMTWLSSFAIGMIALTLLACDIGSLFGSGTNTSGASAATQQTLEAKVQRRVQQTAQAVKQTAVPPAAVTMATPALPPVPTLAVALKASPAPTAPPTFAQNRRLNTGTIVKRSPTWSAGAESYIAISNPLALDAVVLLTENNAPGIAVFVRAKESFRLNNIPTGSYGFWYVLGEDWDAANATFTRNVEYHTFTRPMGFTRTLNPSNSTYTYTYWQTPLTVANDDPEQPVIDASEFPSLK